jgi:hypothetical protein
MNWFKFSAIPAYMIIAIVSDTALASGFIVDPKLVNSSGAVVTLSDVSWRGSYNPTIGAPLNPPTIGVGKTSVGRFKTVLSTGDGGLTFTANIAGTSPVKKCLFTFTISNSSGTLSAVKGTRIAGTPLPVCTATVNGTSIVFTIRK